MSPKQLRATARGVNFELSGEGAAELLRCLGDEDATELVLSAGSLLTLADLVYGQQLEQSDAVDLLRRADGDFDLAALRLQERYDPAGYWRDVHCLEAARRRLEKRYYGRDARQRHAVFLSSISRLTLGRQAVLLLSAADDADLTNPSAAYYRRRVLKAIGRETDRRYPRRDTVTVAAEGSRHLERVSAAEAEERAARDMVIRQLPALSARVDRLSSRRLRHDVEHILNALRGRLARAIVQGWEPRPELYARQVSALVLSESEKSDRSAS